MSDYKIIERGNGVGLVDYFDEHWYQVDGLFPECIKCGGAAVGEDMRCLDCGSLAIYRKIKSVSMVIGVIDKGFGFKEWLKSVGPNADYISRQAAESGSKLHDAFEKAMMGDVVNTDTYSFTKKEAKKFNNWADWYEGLDITPRHIELSVYGEWETGEAPDGITVPQWRWMNYVAGTADLIADVKYSETKGSGKNKVIIEHNDTWILDWKTGNSTYETSSLQIAAYAKMYNDMLEKGIVSGKKITRGGIVHVGASTRTKSGLNNIGVSVKEIDLEADAVSFNDALKVFNRFNRTLKAPSDIYPLERKLTCGVFFPPQ